MSRSNPCILVFTILATLASPAIAAPEKPNVLFILADDLGWGDLGCYGHRALKTPQIDQLATEGTLFTQFYVNASVCSPSRCAFLTGQYPARHRIHGHYASPKKNEARAMSQWLDPGVPNIASTLKSHGYTTAHIGKWHLGHGRDAPEPSAYGFDFVRAVVSAQPAWDTRDSGAFWPKSTALFVDEAIRFMRDNADRPFYLNLWTLLPHAPLNPTDAQLGPFNRFSWNRGEQYKSAETIYYASVADLDTQIGRLLAELGKLGLADRTIVAFASDNGPEDIHVRNAGHSGVGSAGPFRGRKRSLYEGGVRVPLIVRWPGQTPAGTVDSQTVIAGVDFLPTVCKLAGANIPADHPLDGEDMSEALLGNARTRTKPLMWEWRFHIFGEPFHRSPTLSIRDGTWSLLMNPDRSRIELYDIPHDPTQLNNLAEEHPEIVERLSETVLSWQKTLPTGPVEPSAGKNDYPWPDGRSVLAPSGRLADLLAEPLIDPALPWREIRAYVEARIPVPQPPTSRAEWEAEAAQIRRKMLDKIVFRGEAAHWRDAPSRVEWFDSIETGSGYRIRKFRYEALPGFWAPALLYEPSEMSEKMPVFINLNGHHRGGKAMPYKQRRCINLAKRGILAFNLEFIDMGQLHEPIDPCAANAPRAPIGSPEVTGETREAGLTDCAAINKNLNKHNRLVQIDLCGTSGLAPFWLVMTRGLDIALSHESSDPSRVGVAGLSGGGWQTIWLASLDTRITLANPVAGYGSTFVRSGRRNNIGDAEQIPSDMCKVGDYTHLTALVAPRPLLLTNNAKDDCCFLPQDVFPRLKDAALPIYHMYDRLDHFSTHINYEPGTHNFDSDNREALYRQLQAHFFADDPTFDSTDIAVSEDELKSEAELAVPMPEGNASLHSLAVELSRSLPEGTDLPSEKGKARAWQSSARARLRALVHYEDYDATRQVIKQEQVEGVAADQVHFRLDDTWTLPAVVLTPAKYESTVILISDEGRAALAKQAQRHAAAGRRVVVVDLTGFGEARGDLKDVEPLLIATVGRRPLGVYAGQLAAIARWSKGDESNHAVTVIATGPRNGTIALVAGALETDAVSALRLHGSWGSLRQLIEKNLSAEDAPEQFCFGLLKELDIPQLIALVAPRSVVVHEPDAEFRAQRGTLKSWYATLGVDFDPFRNESSSRTIQE